MSAQAATRVTAAADDHGPTDLTDRDDAVDESPAASQIDIAQATSWLHAQIEIRRPPPGAVTDSWALGIGSLLAAHPRTPNSARGVLGRLDRYGGLMISQSGLAIDGTEIAWSAITEIRTQNVVDYLASDGLSQQLNSIPVPRFPGRKRLLSALSGAILTMLMAAAERQIADGADIRIPAEVEFSGVLRSKKIAPGILAALVLTDASVNRCLMDTATAHGVRVRAGNETSIQDAQQRAAALKGKLAAVQARFGGSSDRDASIV